VYQPAPIFLLILKFDELNLSPEVLQGVMDMGFDSPTKIQTEAIPIALEGHDILASSQTGSGKTAAFAIPILQKLMASKAQGTRALILAPTRELAQQIDEHFWSLGYHTGLTSVTVYGGANWSEQEKALKGGVDIVVATPGRLLDMMKIIAVDFSNLEILVLDEADRMLDMGFIPDVRNIVNRLPKNRQTVMFSATLTGKIESLAREMTRNPKSISVGIVKPAAKISQYYYEVPERLKVSLVLHLADTLKWKSAVIFAATKRGVDQLYRALNQKGLQVTSIHGDRDQKEREAALHSFRTGKFSTIVATDVMARGIDVDNITHIINFDVPNDLDDYIHRIGRTARAEASGDAITFVSRRDKPQMDSFLRTLKTDINRLDIPAEVDSGSSKDAHQDDDRPGRSRSGSRSGSRTGSSSRDRGRGRDSDRERDHDRDDSRRDQRSDQKARPAPDKSADQDTGKAAAKQPEAKPAAAESGSDKSQDDESREKRPARGRGRGRGRGRSGRKPAGDGNKPAEGTADAKSDDRQNGRDKKDATAGREARGRGQKAGDRTSGGRRGERPNRGEKNVSHDEQRIKKQEKLFEQLKSPEIREGRSRAQKENGNGNDSQAGAGLWGKLKKKIFGA
jgi:ATP-dependent RNA helicase RhlE